MRPSHQTLKPFVFTGLGFSLTWLLHVGLTSFPQPPDILVGLHNTGSTLRFCFLSQAEISWNPLPHRSNGLHKQTSHLLCSEPLNFQADSDSLCLSTSYPVSMGAQWFYVHSHHRTWGACHRLWENEDWTGVHTTQEPYCTL